MDPKTRAGERGGGPVDLLIAKHAGRTDLHVTRVLGALVVVSEGRVIDVDRARSLQHCPLQSLLSAKSIEEYAAEKIRRFGQFTAGREVLRSSVAVPFGTSEMFMYALRKGELDGAVIVCDGAGTVVTDNPDVVQGIGARMNGLFHTTPIAAVQDRLRRHGALLFGDARIDQSAGLEAAAARGYRRIGVTVNGYRGESLVKLRATARRVSVEATIAVVCTTGVAAGRAREAALRADLVWACASRQAREAGSEARLQITRGIPIFVYTPAGLRVAAAYSDAEGARILTALRSPDRYLLASTPGGDPVIQSVISNAGCCHSRSGIPARPGQPGMADLLQASCNTNDALYRMGQRRLWLSRADLPVCGRGPEPLR